MTDITLGETHDFKFTTAAPDTGVPATLSGTPVISAYVDNSTTQITAGITLTVDLDGVTGLNNVRVAATSGNGYATGTNVSLVITTGTVDGNSAVGYVVKEFTIGRGASFTKLGAPAGASVSADIAAVKTETAAILVDTGTTLDARIPAALVGGRMDASVGAVAANAITSTAINDGAITAAKIADGAIDEATFATTAGSFAPVGIIRQGTAQSASGNDIVLDAGAAFPDDNLIGKTIMVLGSTQGYWQSALIADNVLATDTVTVTPPTGYVTPSGTITYKIWGTAPAAAGGGSAPTASEIADEVQTRTIAAVTLVNGLAANVITAAATAADFTTEIQSGLATAAAVADLPTNAELATALAAADDATLAAIAALNNLSAAQVNAEVDTALADVGLTTTITGRIDAAVSTRASPAQVATELATYDGPTNAEMVARTLPSAEYATAANLATVDGVVDNLNAGIIYGSAATGTLSTTQATSDLTGYGDDQLIGRVITFLSGACEGESSDITDYASASGLLTFTALTTAPGDGDNFKIT